MTRIPELQQRKAITLLPQYFGSAILIIAILVLAGWQFNIQILASLINGLGATHPFVAISFIAIGLFFIVDGIEQKPVLKQVSGSCLSLIPILVGGITIAEFVFHFTSPIETLLYPTKLVTYGFKNIPIHITACTAIELFLTGVTLFLMNFKDNRLNALINNLAALIGIVCLLSYISCVYLSSEFQVMAIYTAMAILTGVGFILTSLAIIYSRPNSGFMSAFTTVYPGNHVARIFLPLSIIIPVVFGLFTVYVLRHNVITTEAGMTLLFTLLVLSMFILTWYLGAQINKTNIEQLAAEKLRKSEFYYRSIIELATDAIMITNVKGDFSEVNSFTCELFGYTKEELLQLNVKQLIEPEQFKNDPIRVDLLAEGQSIIRERRMVHKNGTLIETRENVKMLPDGRVLAFVYDITEKKREEIAFRNLFEQLQVSETKFRNAFEYSAIGMALVALEGKWLQVNKQLCRIVGYTEKELLLKTFQDITHPDDLEKDLNLMGQTIDGEINNYQMEKRYFHKNGSVVFAMLNVSLIKDSQSKPLYFAAQIEDITERKNAEIKLLKYNRELFMLNHINDAIVRYKDENALMSQACNLLADYGNYKLAWIGFAPEPGSIEKKVLPITKAGKGIKYLDSIVVDLADENIKKGPVAAALTIGKIKIINHIEDDPYFVPWREIAKQHGLASLICLPFDVSEKRRGVLAIYSAQPDSFDRDEVTILQRITENLAYAIRGIRTMKERDHAIKQIVTSEEKYRLLFESNPLPMWMFSIPDFNIIDVNEAAINHYGYSGEEFIGMAITDLRAEEGADKFIKSYKNQHQDGEGIRDLGIWKHKKKNGEIIDVELFAHNIVYAERKVRLILALDITEKLKADKELHQMNKQLRQFSAHLQNIREEERTYIAREIHDELGQLLTGLKMDVSWLSKKLDSAPEELTKRVDDILQLTDRTIQSVRKIATELRPGILDDLGLEDAIMWQASEFQNKTGIKCDVEGTLKLKKYSTEVSTAAFRILQESLTNIMRHANAKSVMIKMQEAENVLRLEVIDDGNGMVRYNHNGGQSLGIMGMRERATIIGGCLSITSEPSKGTRVQVELPFKSA